MIIDTSITSCLLIHLFTCFLSVFLLVIKQALTDQSYLWILSRRDNLILMVIYVFIPLLFRGCTEADWKHEFLWIHLHTQNTHCKIWLYTRQGRYWQIASAELWLYKMGFKIRCSNTVFYVYFRILSKNWV